MMPTLAPTSVPATACAKLQCAEKEETYFYGYHTNQTCADRCISSNSSWIYASFPYGENYCYCYSKCTRVYADTNIVVTMNGVRVFYRC